MEATSYEKALVADMEKLRLTFEEIWPATYSPDLYKFYGLATACGTLRNEKSQGRIFSAKEVTTPLESAAKKFVKELESERARFENKDEIGREMMKYTGEDRFLEQIREAESQAKQIIAHFTTTRPNPAIYLLNEARLLWSNDELVPKPSKPDSPICKFITSALEVCGITYNENTVDDMLRQRAARPRSGKKKPAN
jgi:hypothetical protein